LDERLDCDDWRVDELNNRDRPRDGVRLRREPVDRRIRGRGDAPCDNGDWLVFDLRKRKIVDSIRPAMNPMRGSYRI